MTTTWLRWSLESRFLPSQQLGKITCAFTYFPACFVQSGIVAPYAEESSHDHPTINDPV